MRRSTLCTHALLGAALGLAPLALAQEDASLIERLGGPADASGRSSIESVTADPIPEAPTSSVSATIGADYNSHFISYGLDVWGGGTDFFGDRSTFNPFAEASLDFGEVLPDGFAPLVATVGVWFDINNNIADSIGGDIQEVDFYGGLGSGIGDFSFSITYQQWNFGGGIEKIVDLGLSYDDSGLFNGDFALNPSFLLHARVDSDESQGLPGEEGIVLVFGIEPSFEIIESDAFPVSMSIPVSLGVAVGDFYLAGEGLAYASVGAQFGVPLSFIPSDLGEWAFGAGVTAFFTDDEIIVGNPDDAFLTGNFGVSLSF